MNSATEMTATEIQKQTELLVRTVEEAYRKGCLFERESGYNEYVANLTDEERKNNIHIVIIEGLPFYNGEELITESRYKDYLTCNSNIFKEIRLILTNMIKYGDTMVTLIDDSKPQFSYDYEQYLLVDNYDAKQVDFKTTTNVVVPNYAVVKIEGDNNGKKI